MLGLHAFTAKGLNSIPPWGTKILQGAELEKKKKRKKERNLASLTFPSLLATGISRCVLSTQFLGPSFCFK